MLVCFGKIFHFFWPEANPWVAPQHPEAVPRSGSPAPRGGCGQQGIGNLRGTCFRSLPASAHERRRWVRSLLQQDAAKCFLYPAARTRLWALGIRSWAPLPGAGVLPMGLLPIGLDEMFFVGKGAGNPAPSFWHTILVTVNLRGKNVPWK